MEYLKVYGTKVNAQKVTSACGEGHLWSEMIYLLIQNEEVEKAVSVMVEHPEGWDHELTCRAVQRISSPDTILRVVKFYLDEAPLKVNELLTLVGTRIDPTRIVEHFKQTKLLPLIKGYLTTIQLNHSVIVNNALNELLLEEEDVEGLRISLAKSDKFDVNLLAKKLEAHELADFRRLAALLYKQSRQWGEAVALLIKEGSLKEAIILAAESRDRAVSEQLARKLAEAGKLQLFLGCCYACADSLYPDVIMECAWRRGWIELVLPFMCQVMRDLQDKVDPIRDPSGSRSSSRLSLPSFKH